MARMGNKIKEKIAKWIENFCFRRSLWFWIENEGWKKEWNCGTISDMDRYLKGWCDRIFCFRRSLYSC
jgi:hypothetical protein